MVNPVKLDIEHIGEELAGPTQKLQKVDMWSTLRSPSSFPG
jgi:hypothetical protein